MLTANKTAASGIRLSGGSRPTYYKYKNTFQLEGGESLPELRIGYQTFGELNKDKSNVVWVFHALTANTNPLQWWPGLIGDNELINPKEHFIVCANVIGSCYGTTGPKDFNPVDGERFLTRFPKVTIRDMVKAHQLLLKHLQIDSIKLGVGGSMGGQQLLEWAVQSPDLFQKIVTVATGARSTPWGIGIRAAQRMAIEADPSFYSSSPKGGWKGLEAARAMAMISYRTSECFNESQQDAPNQLDNYRAESYQRYQGGKLNERFDARTYYTLSKAMDTHDLGRKRGSVAAALAAIKSKTLVIGIEGDILFPETEQKIIAEGIKGAKLAFIPSKYGHDGFLVEAPTISVLVKKFLNEQ
ncbi:homoserine O-acetyltransferase family protein [Roseivirga pacifica]